MNTVENNQEKIVINNAILVDEFRAEGGKIVHIRPTDRRRGITIAFKERSGHIEIATAVTHRSDTFTKKIGTKTAIEHFKAGRVVTLPATKNTTRSLKEFFGWAWY